MKYLFLLYTLLLVYPLSQAQDKVIERTYVYVDKDYYLAGETIWLKLFVVDENIHPSHLSKVGYVEICDTERLQMQLSLALENGCGYGKIQIPKDLPSGIYQLSGYTRYMRNEGENAFFKREIAIINMGKQSVADRIELNDLTQNSQKIIKTDTKKSNILINTDKNEYGNREKVTLTLTNVPDNAMDLVVSVSRDDSVVILPEVNNEEWMSYVKNTPAPSTPQQWEPEYEGHIITGQLVPELQGDQVISNISFVGKGVSYINGKTNPINGTASFYTTGVFGPKEVVSSVSSSGSESLDYRIDILSPFHGYLPKELPVLSVFPNKKQLMDRYIGMQLQRNKENDTTSTPTQSDNYFHFPISASYDLDEYTRFNSISETILEFITWVRVGKEEGVKKIKVYSEEESRYTGNTLVLLDGIPIHNHEDILSYNPQNIKKMDIYEETYIFGPSVYYGIVSFVTYKNNLPHFRLDKKSQLFQYNCPMLPVKFESPNYSNTAVKKSRKPDFRHTLYWNPSIQPQKGKPIELSFYTSDLSGAFKIAVEGFTSDGKRVLGNAFLLVKEEK